MDRISAIITSTVCITCSLIASARGNYAQERDTVTFYFDCASSLFNSGTTSDNERLDSLVRFIDTISTQCRDTIHVTIKGSASPEGNSAKNMVLSSRRADTLHAKLRSRVTAKNVSYSMSYIGDNWGELQLLVTAADIADKEEILQLFTLPIETRSGGRVVGSRKRSMMRHKGGRTWRELHSRFFPLLRKTEVTVDYAMEIPLPEPEEPMERASDAILHSDEESARADAAVEFPTEAETAVTEALIHEGMRFLFAVKTNMLLDALAIPNLGVEFPLPKSFSVGADWMYAWWKTDKRHRYWRTYGGDLHIRKWFGTGDTPLTGHHAGVYGQILTYDFEWGNRGYLGDRWSYGAGVEYGYSRKIARRLNIDFTIGIGYLGGEYKEYLPDAGCYVWQVTKQRHWFGPTKAEISLVWLIGNAYTTTKKGGTTL